MTKRGDRGERSERRALSEEAVIDYLKKDSYWTAALAQLLRVEVDDVRRVLDNMRARGLVIYKPGTGWQLVAAARREALPSSVLAVVRRAKKGEYITLQTLSAELGEKIPAIRKLLAPAIARKKLHLSRYYHVKYGPALELHPGELRLVVKELLLRGENSRRHICQAMRDHGVALKRADACLYRMYEDRHIELHPGGKLAITFLGATTLEEEMFKWPAKLLAEAKEADPWRDSHPPEGVLVDYATEKADIETTRAVRAHLFNCGNVECRATIAKHRERHLAELRTLAGQNAENDPEQIGE